jgi:hypothetical protein
VQVYRATFSLLKDPDLEPESIKVGSGSEYEKNHSGSATLQFFVRDTMLGDAYSCILTQVP